MAIEHLTKEIIKEGERAAQKALELK